MKVTTQKSEVSTGTHATLGVEMGLTLDKAHGRLRRVFLNLEGSKLVAGGRAERHHRLLGKIFRIPEGMPAFSAIPLGSECFFYRLPGGIARSSLDHRLQAAMPLAST